jgi:Mg2+ and Co2+ transporter CorA
MTVEERLYKLEGIVEGVMAVLPDRVSALEARMDLLRQEVKAEINTAFNKAMLYFTAIAVILGVLTLLR